MPSTPANARHVVIPADSSQPVLMFDTHLAALAHLRRHPEAGIPAALHHPNGQPVLSRAGSDQADALRTRQPGRRY